MSPKATHALTCQKIPLTRLTVLKITFILHIPYTLML